MIQMAMEPTIPQMIARLPPATVPLIEQAVPTGMAMEPAI